MKLTILYLLISFGTAFAQEHIKEADIDITLPNDKWGLANKKSNGNQHIYFFKRQPIMDEKDRPVIANISVVVEDIDPQYDIVTYSAIKRGVAPFQVDKMFIHEDGKINYKNAVGYKGRYTDKFGEHTVYVVHGINKDKGIQIYFDILTELFEQVDNEFQKTLKSIKKAE